MSKDMEELARLEEDFEATALDPRFKDANKLNLLMNIAEAMTGIVFHSFKTSQYEYQDLAEYVQDFFERNDLGPALAEDAFSGDDAVMHKGKLKAFMNYSLVKLALYNRPVETYTLEP